MSTEEKKKIQAWVPVSIWIQIESFGFKSQNEAVNIAFEKLIKIHDNNQVESKENQNDSKNNQLESSMINQLQLKIEGKDRQLEETQRKIKDLEESLRKAPDLVEFAQLRTKSEELEKYNQALKGEMEKQLEFLKGQIVIKDQQIEKQAFSLQSVIQENSRLNVKLLPENTEKKKWWMFWK
jgi:hypothetical protein